MVFGPQTLWFWVDILFVIVYHDTRKHCAYYWRFVSEIQR